MLTACHGLLSAKAGAEGGKSGNTSYGAPAKPLPRPFFHPTLSMPQLGHRRLVVQRTKISISPGPSSSSPPNQDTVLDILIHGYLGGAKDHPVPSQLEGSDDQLLCDLLAKGHGLLASKLHGKTGLIWDGIRRVGSPLLMEQLVDLYALCKQKAGGEGKPMQAAIKIMLFCLQLAECVPFGDPDALPLEKAHQQIGRIMYLANGDLVELGEIISEEEVSGTLARVEKEVNTRLQQVCKEVEGCYQAHVASGLQDADRAAIVRSSREAAKALLCQGGAINVGIIDDLLTELLNRWNSHTPYETHTIYALAMLRNFPELRDKVARIRAPELGARSARSLVEVVLDLPKGAEISDFHAKQTVLAALLSHLRQGRAGSCFASFLPIVLLSADLEACLNDFIDLVERGQLERPVEGNPVPFPLRLRMSRERLVDGFTLDSTGKIVSDKGGGLPFWEAPGLLAACRALGIVDPVEAGQRVLTGLLANRTSPSGVASSFFYLNVSVQEILQGLVQVAHEARPEVRRGYLMSRAVFAFEAQTNCALQRVWEGVIADMAEATEYGFVKPQVVDCLLFALERKLRVLFKGNGELFSSVKETLRRLLMERVRLLFDPSLKGAERDADGHSSQGGFVLLDVEDPEGLKAFVLRVLKEIEGSGDWLPELEEYVRSEAFVVQAMKKCAPITVEDPLKDYEYMDITPWCFKTGANYKSVLPTYFAIRGSPKIASTYHRSAVSLLLQVLDTIHEHQFWVKKSTNPRKVIPAAAHGLHVFSIMLDHPSMTPLLTSPNREEWLKQHLEMPGEKVSQSQIDPSTRLELLAYCFSSFPDELPGKSAFFRDLIDVPYECSVKEYRDRLLERLLKLQSEPRDEYRAATALALDTALVRSLPKLQRAEIQDSALHFGDTHWQTGLRDIHFCVAYNPGTCRLELCEINDDHTELKMLDQAYWIQARNWEIASFA